MRTKKYPGYRVLILIILFFVFGLQMLRAQNKTTKQGATVDTSKLKVKLALESKAYHDKIVLRWAFDESAAWDYLQRKGFVLERHILDANNKPEEQGWTRLTSAPIRPWTEDEFKDYLTKNPSDTNVAVVGQALYGAPSHKNPLENGIESMKESLTEYQNMFGFSMLAADFSPAAANSMGLRWEDTLHVDTTKKYFYRIRVFDTSAEAESFIIDTSLTVSVGKLVNMKDPVPYDVSVSMSGGRVMLKWPVSDIYNKFTAYYVERSSDRKSFTPVNTKPLIFFDNTARLSYTYTDSVAYGQTFYYRVKGSDAFGDMSDYGDTVRIFTAPPIPPQTPALYAQIKGDSAQLKWKMTDNYNPKEYLGFVIRSGDDMDHINQMEVKKLLPMNVFSKTVKITNPHKGRFFQVGIIDTLGNYRFSMPQYVFTYDTIPPNPPVGLSGTIDSAGIMRVKWNMDYNDNVAGYRVFFSNSPNTEYNPITPRPIDDTAFTDTVSMKMLNREVYIKVVAVDGNNNHSNYSAPLKLLRPDVIKPVTPAIDNYHIESNYAQIHWQSSSSSDLKDYLVIRKNDGQDRWILMSVIPKNINEYKDTSVKPAVYYLYSVIAEDTSGLQSDTCMPVKISVYPDRSKNKITDVTINQTDKSVQVSWKTAGDVPVRFIIYKDEGGGLMKYRSVEDAKNVFEENISPQVHFSYAVKAVYKDGSSSQLSEAVKTK